MPTSDQQNMSSRSGPSPNGPWSVPARRPTDNSANNGERLGSANVDVSRILERLGEIESLMGSARRQAQSHPVSGSNAPNPMPNIPPPPQVAVNPHPQPTTSVFPPSLPPQNTPPVWISGNSAPAYSYAPVNNANGPAPRLYNTPPMPLIPPPPYIDSDIFRDFSLSSPQDYFIHETRLYQRINYQAKIRLGYGKAISVLQRELEQSPDYEAIIRPYQIDQPDSLPNLSPLIPNSEARLFADTVRALVDIIGLQRACHLLENAKIEEIPGIRYEIQRVPIPSRPPPIPLEPMNVPPPMVPTEIGPFARPRADSVNSMASSAPTMYSWAAPPPSSMITTPPPSSSNEDEELVGSGVPLEEVVQLPPPHSPAATPGRGILRRASTGPSYGNKRVTINTDRECHHCASHFAPTASFEPVRRVMSPVSMSPVKMEEGQSHPQMDLRPQFHPDHHSRVHSQFDPTAGEDGVLQQMAAAQM
jgi:hypothetical protein